MPKFRVYGEVSAGKFMGTYEASNADEAIELPQNEEGSVSVCHQCAREVDDPQIVRATATNVETGEETCDSPELTWEERARAAGWTPPAKTSVRSGRKRKA
jgi:hypothetical protein